MPRSFEKKDEEEDKREGQGQRHRSREDEASRCVIGNIRSSPAKLAAGAGARRFGAVH